MSQKTGAQLVRYALEQLPVKFTFGIPGVHNTELYDELNKSDTIEPVLVTHEGGGAFMADAISRTSDKVGTLVIVPAAGITHAMSGIGEAYLDGIPMLVISGGTRTDIDSRFQLHELNQVKLLENITKAAYKIEKHAEIVGTIFKAFQAAVGGEPGPVFVEVPVNIQLFKGDAGKLQKYSPPAVKKPDETLIEKAAEVLLGAKKTGIFIGWGARKAEEQVIEIAELLGAPVSTTLQGLSSIRHNHPLHTGMGFSKAAIPAAENAFKDIDCMLAIGTRFAEIPTGSFGAEVPEKLIHIDINPEVFDKNYKTAVAIESDAETALKLLVTKLRDKNIDSAAGAQALKEQIASDKKNYIEEFKAHKSERVNPAVFFEKLRAALKDDAITVVDDGNHTFLAAELFEVTGPEKFISPTDFNCMGYCVPAAIGAKMINPEKQVIGIVGDGAFLMTAMEIMTATAHALGVIYFVFYDGELSQISQGQQIPYNRKTCTVLGEMNISGIAEATGAAYLEMRDNSDIEDVIDRSLEISGRGRPVIVDVRIDYSKRTRFTQGVVKTVLSRFPLGDKFRFIGRALLRKIAG